ncbi:HesB/IscA family protein [Salisediminibacterium beveridgei]|uniref:Iron binding protein, HesB_IscA_SufA family n=1 Tax=Salisediminibacterium beveridgei TaxID=632773 RepID=A0A1D7QSP8_9BACI|nr:iron-sulfur cluster assembly accessory protein [Salisediminibacterium beveridgei]AOM82036.1 iron binding protein, HesB_IscA_SufA family [Salisediminibacterium beveridgei]
MLIITETAAKQVKQMMTDEADAKYLRVGVQGGGCSGLSYGMGFDTEKDADDTLLEVEGIDVIVDKESEAMLKGTTIDYKENMMGGGFTIDNPNAVASCGCGSSFRTAENAGTPEDC